ncbi:hypothetical protein DXG01_009827 [Tephrocybe rancida]|nr:hypothetical protein DXG01_009827 [Tephrocybe rancida]
MSEPPLDTQHALRRSRSTSDIPRQPDPVHRPGSQRHSRSPSDVVDPLHGPRSSAPPHRRHLVRTQMENGRRSPPLAVPLEYPQTHTLGGRRSAHHTRPGDDEDDESMVHEPPPPRSLYRKVMLNLGFGRGASRERRSLVGLILNLVSGSSQIVIVTVILALSGTRFKSPTDPELSEWEACSRPLGPWACIWVFRAVLATNLNYWGFLRERRSLALRRSDRTDSTNTNTTRETQRNPQPRHGANGNTRNTPRAPENNDPVLRDHPSLPHTILYSRWFLTAHILEYTSINTCRHSSPHIWWLTFGILCLMYLMVLEVVILGFVVFVIAPILFLFWNIVLICMGRHPLQTHNTIKPDIGKLPKSIVESIPLVMYIPPPPDALPQQKAWTPELPSSAPRPKPLQPKQRFKFIRRLTSLHNVKSGKAPDSGENKDIEKAGEPQTWEEHWEQGEYPFVVLQENRAACAICLLDFAEPKRIWGHVKAAEIAADTAVSEPGAEPSSVPEFLDAPKKPVQDIANTAMTAPPEAGNADSENTMKLADAGEGSQPLRLLACGHVFHVSVLQAVISIGKARSD